MQNRLLIIVVGCLSVLVNGPVSASEFLEKHGDWDAFADAKANASVCYMGSAPTKEEGDYKKRGEPYVMVTHWPKKKELNVVSFEAGYEFKKGSSLTVSIGTQTFELFTDGSTAWARNAEADKALVDAMRAGASMVAKGESSKGTLTTDTYSLKGVSAAYTVINGACGIR